MATIKPIDDRTVHQIQSGQVIVDLCSVVKELVENSLDASATSIDVRFKNQGLEAIEVQDNGHGIPSNNYPTLALKHHTSKITTYADLTTLETFGFRGEALSSLCAVSRFSVTTCMAADVPKGTKLEFETSGNLKDTSVVAAQRGTTVTVENLFSNLPVRRQELERNIKREWNRVVNVLGQYACIQTGIKFSVSQQAAKGKKTTLFSTKGNQKTRENIVNVFGAKTLAALIALDLNLDLEATSVPSQRWSTQDDGGKKEIRLVGHISRPASGEGRQLPDKQMFFVNSRPCGLPQVTKAFNEVYKSYNGTQSPFIFANIILDTHLYDVNVSPDKRTILLHDQSRMLENLKVSLTALFESQDYTVPISQLPAQKQPLYKQLTISRENTRDWVSNQTPDKTSQGSDIDKLIESTVSNSGSDVERDGSQNNRKHSTSEIASLAPDSMGHPRQDISLISNWAGRNAVVRSTAKAPVAKASKPPNEADNMLEKWRAKDSQDPSLPRASAPQRPESTITTTHGAPNLPTEPLVPDPDEHFNNGLDELECCSSGPEASVDSVETESPIPVLIQTPLSGSGAKNIFDPVTRFSRPSATMATITVGDHTVTSFIGTPPYKRVWTQHTSNKAERPGRYKHDKQIPTFGNKLNQRFAAPGTKWAKLADETLETESSEPSEVEVLDSMEEGCEVQNRDTSRSDSEELADDVQRTESFTLENFSETSLDTFEDGNEVIELPSSQISDLESEKRHQEDAKVKKMIGEAEQAATVTTEDNANRTKALLRGGTKKKESTVDLISFINTSIERVDLEIQSLHEQLPENHQRINMAGTEESGIDASNAEEALSLTISKEDFSRMKVVGQFNLGFILATRCSETTSSDNKPSAHGDDLFIIDQHASDEKYNFERLQASTIVQSQRLVHPKALQLTALEEELVFDNIAALESNGFIIKADHSGSSMVGERCQLVSLPLSRDTTFSTKDLEELLGLLAEHSGGPVPRPTRVRKMHAMRACRSSIMIGKTLTLAQMVKVVRHMGEIDKPWNCPHGRPTMRHLCALGVWDELGWREGDARDGSRSEATDWANYVKET